MTLPAIRLSIALFAALTLNAFASDLLLNDCNTAAAWAGSNGATVIAAAGPSDPAIQITLPANNGGAIPEAYVTNAATAPYVPSGSTATYDGITFWVKGDGSTAWGNIALWYDNVNYYRAYAQFPITTAWAQVFIPWREFYQRSLTGRLETQYPQIFGILFTNSTNVFDGHPLQAVPAMSYQVDNIAMAASIPLAPTPLPTGISIRNTIAKLKAKQPVKIVVAGASIAWGLKCPNPGTDCWPYKLQQLLQTQFGYSNITVINTAIGGFGSFQGACTLGWFSFSQEPIDLIITCDWDTNDHFNASALDSEIGHNYENLFGYALRQNQFELMNVQSGLIVDPSTPGAFHSMDATNATVQGVCNAMNIYTADMYGKFQALGEQWLHDNYYDFAGGYFDTVHFNALAHTAAAQIVLDAFIAAATNHPPTVTSAATATPNPASVNQSVTFSSSGSDLDNDTLAYAWDFGDSSSGSGASATHSYSAVGTYTAVVTISDGNGGSVTSSIAVTINADSSGGGTGGGVTGGTGGGGGSGGGGTTLSFTVARMSGGAKFKSGGHDFCSLSGILPQVPAGFNPNQQTLVLNIKGATVTFLLNAKGQGKAANGAIQLKLKRAKPAKGTKVGVFPGGDVAFVAKIQKGTWAAIWEMDPAVTVATPLYDIPVTIQFAGTVYATTVQAAYSSKAGIGAKFKK
jgi:hypothetical protein